MTKTLTPEQAAKLEESKKALIKQVVETQDTYQTYPTGPDGRPDFSASLITVAPLTEEEVSYLVEKYFAYRLDGMSHGDAARITYACCYKSTDITFDPRGRLEAIRNGK